MEAIPLVSSSAKTSFGLRHFQSRWRAAPSSFTKNETPRAIHCSAGRLPPQLHPCGLVNLGSTLVWLPNSPLSSLRSTALSVNPYVPTRRWAGDVRMVFRVEAVGSGLGHKPGNRGSERPPNIFLDLRTDVA